MARRTITPTTLACWYFEEASHGAHMTMLDSGPNARHLAPFSAAIANSPRVIGARNSNNQNVNYARHFDGANDLMFRSANAGADALALQSTHTIEFFIRRTSTSAMTVGAYNLQAESSVSNCQTQVRINTSGYLVAYWEFTAGGSDQLVTQTTGLTVPLNTWCHVALVIERTSKAVGFYINGALQQLVGYANNPTGGNSAQWVLGSDFPDGTAFGRLNGDLKSFRVVTEVVGDAELAADAALLATTMQHDAARANVLVCFQCNEEPDAKEEVRGYHGIAQVTAIVPNVPWAAGGDRAKFWPSANSQEILCGYSGDYAGVDFAAAFAGNFTLATSFRHHDSAPASPDCGHFRFGPIGVDTAPGNENLFTYEIRNSADFHFANEYGNGVDQSIDQAGILTASSRFGIRHLVITGELVSGGTQQRITIFIDTVQVAQTTWNPFSGGTLSTLTIGGGSSATGTMRGALGPLLIDQQVWSQAEIEADLRTVFADIVPPVIANIVYPDSKYDWLEFDVYDVSPGMGLNLVLVQLGNEHLREAAYDEGAFRGRYLAGGSTLTGSGTPGDPYHFMLRPSGGWPQGVTNYLLPRFGDTAGNLQFGPA